MNALEKNARGRPRTDARERILDAARALIGRDGFDATSVPDIVARADVAQGTFYRYFKSKSQLAEAMAHTFNTQILALFDPVFASDRPLSEVMPGVIGSILMHLKNYHDILPFIQDHIMPFGSTDAAIAIRNAHYDRLAEIIARDQADELVRADIEPKLLARLIGGTFQNMARLVSLEESDMAAEDVFASTEAFVKAALVPQQEDTT